VKLTPVDLTEVEDLITESEALAAKAVNRVVKRLVADVQANGVQMVAAGQPSSPAGSPSTPPFGALGSLYQYWSEVISDLFTPFMLKSWRTGVDAAIKSINHYEPEWDVPSVDPLMLESLQHATNRVQGLSTVLWQHAQDEMVTGVEAGDSIHQMAARVSTVAGLTIPHAQSVVRTEVVAAANAGSADLIALAGFTGTQQWLATNDPKTRVTHKQADGQVVAIGEMFSVGGWMASHPGSTTLPPGERINCRCSVAYDLDDESVVASMIAAGKGFNELHPRDTKGKFVKKSFLSLLKHDASEHDINTALDDMSFDDWNNLTPAQQLAIDNEISLNGSEEAWDSFVALKNAAAKHMVKTPAPAASASKQGAVKKITHKDIHSPKKDGEVLGVSYDGDGEVILWNESQKKYVSVTSGKQTYISKSKVYEHMQGKTWHEPSKATAPEPEKQLKLDMPSVGTKAAAKKGVKKAAPLKKVAEPKFLEKTKDFSNFDKQSGQLGSNQGGMFTSAEGGEKWYIKKAKSEKHAANEVAASMFYTLGGVDAPFVNKGSGAPGIGGGLQTGTKIVPGAKSDLSTKLKTDPAYLKEVQKGFVMDAWLANWDVAGLSYDNIVTGADGKPHRIDVGGAMLYRAQGSPKGDKFGDTVPELESMRSPSNPQANAVFGSMTDDDIRESAKNLEDITPEMIDKVVKDSGLPSSVADTLKKRREFILAKYGSNTKSPIAVSTIKADKFKTVDEPSKPAASKADWANVIMDVAKGNYSTGDDIAVNDDGSYMTYEGGGLVTMHDATTGATLGPTENVPTLYGFKEDHTWKTYNPLDASPKKDVTGPPDDPDWGALADDIKVGVYSPGTIIAENGDGDYIELNDLNEVELYSADGELIETADSMDVESLTQSGFGWKVVDKNDELGEPPTPLPAPGGSGAPSKIGVHDVPETIDGKSIKQIWSHTPESKNGTIAVETSDGQMWTITNGTAPISSSWHEGTLNALNFKKEFTTDLPTPSTLPVPGAPSLPDTVNGIKIPHLVATPNGMVKIKEVHANSGSVYALDTNGDLWFITKNSNPAKVSTPSSAIIGQFGLKKLDGSHVDTTLKPTVATPTSTAHGSTLPWLVKDKAKQTMKSEGLGYWSKPEKIWNVIKDVQSSYPDPNNPGQSKYTPLQILESLDSQLKTSKPNPYSEKIKKWANTYAGKKHIEATGGLPSGVATPTAAPVKGAKKVANAAAPNVAPEIKTVLGDNNIDAVPDAVKISIFNDFKDEGSGSYLSSPDDIKYAVYQKLATQHNMSILQIVKIIDERGAKKVDKPNANLFEKKLVAWAKTNQGIAKITGKAAPTPSMPALKFNGTVPTKADSDHMKYEVISYKKAEQLQAAAEAQHSAITPGEKTGLKHYTGGNYTAINNYLRGETDYISPSDEKHYLNAQKGFRPSVEPMLLHRGVGWSALGFGSTPTEAQLQALVGKKGTHKGFSSSSIGGKAAFGGPLLLVIEAPTGTPMAFVDPFSKNKGENEMLLPAGTDFEILQIEHYGGSGGYGSHGATRVRVRIIP
jgi:hypothetical protein